MVGDEAELYRSLSARLERIVGVEVQAPREVIEDACHDAWTKLINRSEQIQRETALSWLVTTAVRQAWRLDRRERREASLEAATEATVELRAPAWRSEPVEHVEQKERLGEIRQLPERQQRLIWLRAAGLSYIEMAAYTGESVRTVERQILRATSRMREAQQRAAPAAERHVVPIVAAVTGPQPHPRSPKLRGLER
jgi:RNA polymerase sigma factor (sigma-70 family)